MVSMVDHSLHKQIEPIFMNSEKSSIERESLLIIDLGGMLLLLVVPRDLPSSVG
jgi:hypothetical protein